MKSLPHVLFLAASLMATHAAGVNTIEGNGALALGALVGSASPLVDSEAKRVLGALLDGHVNALSDRILAIRAKEVSCRVSSVNITLSRCELNFGASTVELQGRAAHELFATIAQVGIEPDGAAGSVYEALTGLNCTIDLRALKENAGAGAHCVYDNLE